MKACCRCKGCIVPNCIVPRSGVRWGGYDGLALPGNNYLDPPVWGRESVDLPVSRGVALIFLVVGVA